MCDDIFIANSWHSCLGGSFTVVYLCERFNIVSVVIFQSDTFPLVIVESGRLLT